MKLLVRNLVRSITEAELTEMFEAYGKVQSCSLVIDPKTGRSKGFGFVEMPNPGEAKAAAKSLNGQDVKGLAVRVKKADETVEDVIKPEKKDKYRDKAAAAKQARPEPEQPKSRKPRTEPQPKPKFQPLQQSKRRLSEPSPVADSVEKAKPTAADSAEPAPVKKVSAWANAKPKPADDE